jgi:LSD1 subclass zinc finger protein
VSADPDPYTRCPDCGFIAPPESMDYALTPDDGIDWDRPVRVTCICCRASHHISAGDVLQADAEMTCHRCGTTTAYPAGAARVQCPGCGLFLLGPDLTAAQRDELAVTEGLAGFALRETYLAAKERAAQRRAGGQ